MGLLNLKPAVRGDEVFLVNPGQEGRPGGTSGLQVSALMHDGVACTIGKYVKPVDGGVCVTAAAFTAAIDMLFLHTRQFTLVIDCNLSPDLLAALRWIARMRYGPACCKITTLPSCIKPEHFKLVDGQTKHHTL